MSYSIPVFYFPTEKSEVPPKLENWHSAEQLIGEKWKRKSEYRFYTITSRNWWVQHALFLICEGLEIEGLEFIMSEIVCLEGSDLKKAENALNILLGKLKNGIPKLNSKIEGEGSIWGLRKYIKNGQEKSYTKEEIIKALNEAKSAFDINACDIGHESVVDFFSFSKSLLDAITYCLSKEKCLLYVQPQP